MDTFDSEFNYSMYDYPKSPSLSFKESIMDESPITYKNANYCERCKLLEDQQHPVNHISVCRTPYHGITYFATASRNRCNIYSIDQSGEMEKLQEYIDENKCEVFHACCWLVTHDNSEYQYYLLIGGNDGLIKVINCIKMTIDIVLQAHYGSIRVLAALHQHEHCFISGSVDGYLHIWDIRKTTPIHSLVFHEKFSVIEALDIHMHDDKLVVGDRNGMICLYSLKENEGTYHSELCYTYCVSTGFTSIIFQINKPNISFIGNLLVGFINGKFCLHSPAIQQENSIINIVMRYAVNFYTDFCINSSYSKIACISGIIITIITIDNGEQATFDAGTFSNPPLLISFLNENDDLLCVFQNNEIVRYSISQSDAPLLIQKGSIDDPISSDPPLSPYLTPFDNSFSYY